MQTDLFTGAAGSSYPIQVPPGRGGLTPKLALSYSSTDVDMLNSNAQVSYVGSGWGFDTGYVARDTRNTFDTGDDVFSLVLNGASYDLVLGADGAWHTNKEQYWRIKKSNNALWWEVTTNDGTTYKFGDDDAHNAKEIRRDQWNNWYSGVYQYWLATVTDTHGNKIQYTYAHEQGTCTQGTYDFSVHPSKIEYNWNGSTYLTRIDFAWSLRNDRHVYYPANQCGPAPYEKKKLDVGNILSAQDNARGETTNYTYDDLDRLLSASVTNGPNQYSRSWTYDSIGNMQTRVEQGATTTYPTTQPTNTRSSRRELFLWSLSRSMREREWKHDQTQRHERRMFQRRPTDV